MVRYNVFTMNNETNQIEFYNIFDNYRFLQKVSKLLGWYDRLEKEDLNYLKDFQLDEQVTKREIKKTEELWDASRLENFKKDADKIIYFYFMQKCKNNLFLDTWPNKIPVSDFIKLNTDFLSNKISIYDQIKLNWEVFILYLQENKKEIRLLAKEEKEKRKKLVLQQ